MPNVTEEKIKEYVEVFHATIDEVSSRFFDAEQASNLFYKSLLPARIICYVSTQFGIAIEYVDASHTEIETIRSSRRVEDMFVQAPKSIRNIGPLLKIGADGIQVIGLSLTNGFPFRLSNFDANVKFRDVCFSVDGLGWKREVRYAEVYGNRSITAWSPLSAQNRAKDEVLAALFLERKAKEQKLSLHEYVTSFREKSVLLLGSYDNEGQKRLAAISESIIKVGYDPILIKDIPDFEHYDISQKVTVIGAISRFVIVDDSSPSGHLSEIEICKQNRWVTILLRLDGHGSSWMTAGVSNTSNVILEQSYDLSDPYIAISKSTQWAESRLKDLESTMNKIYPWRTKS